MPKVHFASCKDTDMFYVVRKNIPDPFFYIATGEKRLVFLNALEIDAFNEHNTDPSLQAVPVQSLAEDMRALKVEASPYQKLALAVWTKYLSLEKPISVSKHFPLDLADFLRAQGAKLVVAESLFPERRHKRKENIERIRESARATSKAFEKIEQVLQESHIKGDELIYKGAVLTSENLKQDIELLLFAHNMESPEGLIISCGRHAAMPHHGGLGPIRPHQTIVCDIFPRDRTSGYFADMTRTYVKGTPSKEAAQMYVAVQEAQSEAMEKVIAGAKAADVHNVSADVIKKHGFDVGEKGYIHGLGHGVGLDVHEAPSVSPNSKDILEEGDVITIEPGLYYPQWGGVRLEDMVLVTRRGYECLSVHESNFVIA